jgi:hypothetical protein
MLLPTTGREMRFMAVPTEKVAGTPIKATFLIRSDWANRAAVYPLLVAATESHMLQDVLIVPVTDFDLSDGVFVTITFYPSVLEGRSVRLFIPKSEVLSIMILENYQDRAVLGFHPPELGT